MSLVLLRRVLSSSYDEFWTAVGREFQEQFHERILKCVTTEREVILKKRLTDVLAELARNTISNYYFSTCFVVNFFMY